MIVDLIKNKIEECYNNNIPFNKLLSFRFKTDFKEIVFKELNDFILSKNDVYKSDNFMKFIYEAFLQMDNSRFTNFLRNLITEHPDIDRTYSHMMNDIKDKVDTKYKLDESYYSMTKYELNKKCDELFLEGKFLQLKNTRQFINDSFRIERYESFVFENRDLAKVLLKKNDLDETDRIYIRMREMLSAKPKLLGLFTYFNKVEKIGFGRLKTLYQKLISSTSILNQLPKDLLQYMPRRGVFRGAFTTEDGRTYNTHFEQLEDDLLRLEEIHNAKLFANEYPGIIKKDLHLNSDFQEIVRELTSNTDKSKEKLELYKKFWLNKVSRYETQEELIKSLTNFVYSDNSADDIKNMVEGNYQLNNVFYDGELMVVRVLSYEAIQNIGSDTSWCIKDSLSYWTDYVNGTNVQLVILDFSVPRTSPLRKIGVTIYGNGNFYTAHNINDSYMNESNVNKVLEKGGVTLNDMYEVAKDLGTNEYYDDSEITDESYGGW